MSDHIKRANQFSDLHRRIYESAKKHGLIVPGQMLPENSAVMSFIRDACDEALKEDPQQQRKFALLQAASVIYAAMPETYKATTPSNSTAVSEAQHLLQIVEIREAAHVQEPKS